MWGKTLAWIIVVILAFATIIAWIPDYFSADVTTQDPVIVNTLIANDLIVYDNQGQDNITGLGYSSLYDAPSPPQWNVSLPSGEYLEIIWGWESYEENINARHVTTQWFGYAIKEKLTFYHKNGTRITGAAGGAAYWDLTKDDLIEGWSDETNSSAFTAQGSQIKVSIVFFPSGGYTDIGESFENSYLDYALSYEWNAEDTGFNVMNIIINLLSFKGIGVGVPGILGNFIDSLVSTLFYIAIAIVAYVIITSVIPFISGAPDT